MTALLSAPASSEEAVHVTVSPAVTQQPATITIRVTLARDTDNRELDVALDGEDFYRGSSMTLDGADGPSVYVLTFTGVPAGAYMVDARVRRVRGSASAHTQLRVVGFSAD
jgi:hypothetical protein